MSLTLAGMAKAPRDKSPKKDNRKPSYQTRVRMVFVPGLEKMAELNGTEIPDEVNTAIREYLQKHGLWPAPAAAPTPPHGHHRPGAG